MSITTADARTSKKVMDAKKPIDRVQSLAETIIYSVAEDAEPAKSSSATATPGTATPVNPALNRVQNGSGMKRNDSSDSLAAAGQKGDAERKYMAGSKALDHLSRLLTSCETVSSMRLTNQLSAGLELTFPVLPPKQLWSLVCFPHHLPRAPRTQLCRTVEGTGRAFMQDAGRLALDPGDKEGVRAGHATSGPDFHVQ